MTCFAGGEDPPYVSGKWLKGRLTLFDWSHEPDEPGTLLPRVSIRTRTTSFRLIKKSITPRLCDVWWLALQTAACQSVCLISDP